MPNMNNLIAWPGLDWADQDPTKPVSANRMESMTDAVEEIDPRNPLSPGTKVADQRYIRKDARSIDVRQFGAVGDWNKTTDTGTMDTAAFDQAIALAHDRGVPIYYGPDALGRANFCVASTVTDKNFDIDPASRGTIMHPQGATGLRIVHTMGTERPVSASTNVWVRNNDSGTAWQVYPEVTIAAAAMVADNPQQGDAYTIADGTALVGDFIGDGKSTWQKEWLSVLGRGLDVTDVGTLATEKILQGHRVVGQTSHASAVVAAKVQSLDGAVKVALNNVVHGDNGTFQAGENLLVNGVVKGTVTARAPYLIGANPLIHTYSVTPMLQKGRTDLRTNLNGLVVAASGDIDQMLETLEGPNTGKRQPAVEIENVVNCRGKVHIKDAWQGGISMRGVYLAQMEITCDKLGSYAEDEEADWGYALVLWGACDRSAFLMPMVKNVRHGITSNIRPQNARPADADYRATAGVSHYITVSGNFYHCLDAAVDQHGGSMFWRVLNTTILGGGSFGRTQARGAGIQNRGFGILAQNVTIDGTTDGVRDIGPYWPVPFTFTNTYRNITMRNIRRYGYNLIAGSKGAETNGVARTVIEKSRCSFIQMPSAAVTGGNINPNEQLHVNMDFGRLELIDVDTMVGNTAAGRFGALDELVIRGGLTDHSTQTVGTTTWNCDSPTAIPTLIIVNHLVRGGPISAGSSVVRAAGANQTIFTAGCGNIALSSTFPFAVATAGNTITVQSIKESGVLVAAQMSNYDPAIITAGSTLNVTVTVTGATLGDFALPSFTGAGIAGVTMTAAVIATDTVVVSFRNSTAVDQNLPVGNLRVRVWK